MWCVSVFSVFDCFSLYIESLKVSRLPACLPSTHTGSSLSFGSLSWWDCDLLKVDRTKPAAAVPSQQQRATWTRRVWSDVATGSFMLHVYNLVRKPSWRERREAADFANTWATGVSRSWNSSDSEVLSDQHMTRTITTWGSNTIHWSELEKSNIKYINKYIYIYIHIYAYIELNIDLFNKVLFDILLVSC